MSVHMIGIYKGIIADGYEAADIIKNISLIDPSKKFVPGKTLIFFDGITEFPEIATSLKFFCIDGRFDVICRRNTIVRQRTEQKEKV